MIEKLAKILGMSPTDLKDLIPILSLVLALLIALLSWVKPIRQVFIKMIRDLINQIGITKARYKRNFLSLHSTLRNIYLDRIEELNLQTTYIPLHVRIQNKAERKSAISVLSDPQVQRIIILGDPGTGKTTLVKAFGVGILQELSSRRDKEVKLTKNLREIPFLVDLRHFASQQYSDMPLFEYLVEYILKQQIHIQGGESFLAGLLSKRKCLVLLDGLDEVSEQEYPKLLSRVASFCNSEDADLPTNLARIIITCRTQNFRRIRGDWMPKLFPAEHILAPFTDDDIFAFLNKRKADFSDNRSPEQFFAQIQSSGMIDLHRSPLILTVSLGLYLNVPKYRIPRFISQFYEEMIKELLRRHDFRTRSDIQRANQFESEDKFRFLREFALLMAERGERFEVFSYEEIRNCLLSMYNRMADVDQPDIDEFLREIIDRAGLLKRVSDEDHYIFAHRSIHEYFAALELSRNPRDGANKLIELVHNPLWREVIIFFAALDHIEVESFVDKLANENLELAGHCLTAMQILPEELASRIIGLLQNVISRADLTTTLAALASITASQKQQIRKMALDAIQAIITNLFQADDMSALSALKREDMVQLLTQLANVGSRELVDACLGIANNMEDGIDLIAPLWRSLNLMELPEDEGMLKQIVTRLLDLSMSQEGTDELQNQPQLRPDFITEQLQREVYPFKEAHNIDSNLVTLLAWAERVHANPTKPNVFFQAKSEDKDAWMTIEQDSKRKALSIRPYPIGVVLTFLPLLVSVVILPILVSTYGWQNFTETYIPLVNISPYYALLYVILGPSTTLLMGPISGVLPRELRLVSILGSPRGNFIVWWCDDWLRPLYLDGTYDWSDPDLYWFCFFLILPLIVASALWQILLAGTPLLVQIAGNISLNFLFFWLPATELFEKDREVFIRKPNPFIGIYDDPRSVAWIRL